MGKLKALHKLKALSVNHLDMENFSEILNLPVLPNITYLTIRKPKEFNIEHIPAVISNCFPFLEFLDFHDIKTSISADFSSLPSSFYVVKTTFQLFENFLNCAHIKCLSLDSFCLPVDHNEFAEKIIGAESLQISVLKVKFWGPSEFTEFINVATALIASLTHLEVLDFDASSYRPQTSYSYESDLAKLFKGQTDFVSDEFPFLLDKVKDLCSNRRIQVLVF